MAQAGRRSICSAVGRAPNVVTSGELFFRLVYVFAVTQPLLE